MGLAPGYDPLERRNADSGKKKLSSEAAARLVAERGLPGGFVFCRGGSRGLGLVRM